MVMELLRLVLIPVMLLLSFFFCDGGIMDCGGNKIQRTIVVDKSGHGHFKSIQAAIDSIKENNDQWVKVQITAGIYKEKVRISAYKACIFLEGAGREMTTITSMGKYIQDPSFIFSAPNLVAIGITFENTFNIVGSRPITRAVAAAIYGDKSVFYKCGFISFQDTLFDAKGRHYFKDCYIQGEVDFIFGGGQSYYEACRINATQGKCPPGFVTAHFRDSENDSSGFVFRGCSIDGSGKVNLGRAWGPYSRVIFHESYFSSVVTSKGWNAWNFKGHESKLTFAEVNCKGAGANTTKRVPWLKKLSNLDLNDFSLSSFINKDGWLSYLPVSF